MEWVFILIEFMLCYKYMKYLKIINAFIYLSITLIVSTVINYLFMDASIVTGDIFEILKPIIYLIMFYSIYTAVNVNEESKKYLSIILLFLFVILALIMILQYLEIGIAEKLATYSLTEERIEEFQGNRSVGTIGNPNAAGAIINFGIILAYSIDFKKFKIIKYITLVILSLAVVITGSRTALIALILIYLTILIKDYKKILKINPIYIITAIIIFNFYIISDLLNHSISDRFELNEQSMQSFQDRLEAWDMTLALSLDNIIFGYGPNKGGFDLSSNVDNEIVLVLYRTGIIGVIIFINWIYNLSNLIPIYFNTIKICIFMNVFVTLFAGSMFYNFRIYSVFLLVLVFFSNKNFRIDELRFK